MSDSKNIIVIEVGMAKGETDFSYCEFGHFSTDRRAQDFMDLQKPFLNDACTSWHQFIITEGEDDAG